MYRLPCKLNELMAWTRLDTGTLLPDPACRALSTHRGFIDTNTVYCTRRCCAWTSFEACPIGRIGRSETQSSKSCGKAPEDSLGMWFAIGRIGRKSCGKAPEDSLDLVSVSLMCFPATVSGCKRIWCKVIAVAAR